MTANDRRGRAARVWWKRALDVGPWFVVLGLLIWRFGPQVEAAPD